MSAIFRDVGGEGLALKTHGIACQSAGCLETLTNGRAAILQCLDGRWDVLGERHRADGTQAQGEEKGAGQVAHAVGFQWLNWLSVLIGGYRALRVLTRAKKTRASACERGL
jgi:hypothetical protein